MAKEDDKESVLEKLLDLLLFAEVSFFRDQFNEVYAVIKYDGSTVMKVDSSEFQQWIYNFIYEKTKTTTTDSTIQTIIKLKKYEAQQDEVINLSARVAQDDAIYYDLGREYNVRIDMEGWEVLDTRLPVLFKRFSHQKTQTQPQQEGNLGGIFDLINLRDEKEKLLLMVYLVAAFIPDFPHPILVVHGSQGSAKSTLSKMIKDLVDPSSLETSSINDDRDLKDLVQTASHHWLLVLDNISYISEKVSDTLARICTGGGLSKRKHYSNDDDFVYNYKHILVLNGVSQFVSKPDLLDRCILLALDRIPEEKRLTEQEVWGKYNALKPQLLGAIFTAVSGAMREYPNVHLESLPRMADFAKWGCAIAIALGYKAEDFIRVYTANVGRQNQEAIGASSIATVIVEYMKDKDSVEQTPSELLSELEFVAIDLKLKDTKNFPRDATWLWRRIEEVIPNLATLGIKAERTKDAQRKVRLQKDSTTNADSVLISQEVLFGAVKDSMDSKDSISSLSGLKEKKVEEER